MLAFGFLFAFIAPSYGLDEPACPAALRNARILLSHDPREPKLRIVRVELKEKEPGSRVYNTPYLWFRLGALDKALTVNEGQTLKIETRLESLDGQVQVMTATLKEASGDEIGNFSFNQDGEFVSGQALVSKASLKQLGIFKYPDEVFRFFHSKGRPIAVQGEKNTFIQSGSGDPIFLRPSAVGRQHQERSPMGLIPADILRPIHRRLHPTSPQDAQEVHIHLIIEQIFEGPSKRTVFAALHRQIRLGKKNRKNPSAFVLSASDWREEVILQRTEARTNGDLPLAIIEVDNKNPERPMEDAVPRQKPEAKESNGDAAIAEIYIDLPNAEGKQERIAAYLYGSPGEYYFEFYYELMPPSENILPSKDLRAPLMRRQVGMTNPSDSRVLDFENIVWLDDAAEKHFKQNWIELRNKFSQP